MNLKHFYYRGYFDGRIRLAQPPKGDARKKNEDVNERAFRLKNATLTSTAFVAPFSPTDFQKIGTVQELRLEVQNPGLLPGIGYPHEVGYPGEFKLGFGFDHVSGLPVLPGSSVKGVLRSVFPQFKFDAEQPQNLKTGDELQIEKAKFVVNLLRRLGLEVPAEANLEATKKLAHALELSIFCGYDFSSFGKPVRLPMSQHDVFFDALPVRFSKNQLLGRDALTPHGDNPLKNPIPLPFVKVMPGVVFGFYFRLKTTKIGLPEGSLKISAEQKRLIFGEILCTVGAGAKTNVGYGQFDVLEKKERLPRPILPQAAVASAVASQNPTPAAPRPSAPKLQFSKGLKGKKVLGEVVSANGKNPVRFRILNVEGFEKEVSVNVPERMLSKFEQHLRFELTVSDSRPDKSELILKAEDFRIV